MFSLIPLPYKIGAIIAALSLSAWLIHQDGFDSGALTVQRKWDAQKIADTALSIKSKVAEEKISEKTDEETQKVLTETRVIYKTINREVPIYVTQKADAACSVPNGFVRLHDTAAQSIISNPASSLNDTPSGIALSTVATTVSENYGTCHEIRQQLIGLQEWVRRQIKLRDQLRSSASNQLFSE